MLPVSTCRLCTMQRAENNPPLLLDEMDGDWLRTGSEGSRLRHESGGRVYV